MDELRDAALGDGAGQGQRGASAGRVGAREDRVVGGLVGDERGAVVGGAEDAVVEEPGDASRVSGEDVSSGERRDGPVQEQRPVSAVGGQQESVAEEGRDVSAGGREDASAEQPR
ncbi:hypothetical protein, partial [Streptomyces sp. NPDC047043]|uniref:hypothetical protein n=1 Tax=Streptomyces sp. NPDC047043 TaxID=3154497 RepID=UPI00340CB11E